MKSQTGSLQKADTISWRVSRRLHPWCKTLSCLLGKKSSRKPKRWVRNVPLRAAEQCRSWGKWSLFWAASPTLSRWLRDRSTADVCPGTWWRTYRRRENPSQESVCVQVVQAEAGGESGCWGSPFVLCPCPAHRELVLPFSLRLGEQLPLPAALGV